MNNYVNRACLINYIVVYHGFWRVSIVLAPIFYIMLHTGMVNHKVGLQEKLAVSI
jgi:hypothetical protein